MKEQWKSRHDSRTQRLEPETNKVKNVTLFKSPLPGVSIETIATLDNLTPAHLLISLLYLAQPFDPSTIYPPQKFYKP